MELLIAIAAGSVVVLTAMAGFRVALQAVAVSNRTSIENMMLRTGVEAALEEVDYWTTSDDPNRPKYQKLRGAAGGSGECLPFTAFRNAPIQVDAQPGLFEEKSQGWNPNPMAWAAFHERSWFRGNTAEAVDDEDLRWGNYTIYSYVDSHLSQVPHHWYENQVKSLVDSLGFYGLCEYMPSNAYFSYHGPPPLGNRGRTDVHLGGMCFAMHRQGQWLNPPDGADFGPKGRIRNSLGTRYILPSTSYAAYKPLSRITVAVGYSGGGTNVTTLKAFLEQAQNHLPMMSTVPSGWPEIDVDVMRFVDSGRMLTACIISGYDAKNGDHYVLPFTCAGTTLRGARQQRRPHKGWVENPYVEPTLDYDRAP